MPARKENEEERLERLRERLYARENNAATPKKRTKLQQQKQAVARDWDVPPAAPKSRVPAAAAQTPEPEPTSHVLDQSFIARFMPRSKTRNGYRVKILLAGAVFFVIALALSSLFLLLGNNTISGSNITLEVSGPFAIGGGAELPLQIAIANENAIAIESATLIIEYPPGTQSAEEEGKELFTVRQELESIQPGQVMNVPARAIIFGEENSEKVINVSIEYRVRGSNATFYKQAEPLRFKISSSPVVLLIDAERSITSGQEAEIKLRVASNSPTPLTNVLVEATYPFGFDFSSASPSPQSGRNVWLIEELEPEETVDITLKGVLTGKSNDERVFDFAVGVPSERDRFALASVFTTGTAEFDIEDPFLGVGVTINGDSGDTVAIASGQTAQVTISFRNTQDETIYDGEIEVSLGGSALSKVDVSASSGGFYSSSNNTIRWDGTDQSSLKEIAPGRTSTVSFSLTPKGDVSRTPEVSIDVTTRGKRVFEDRVPQELVSTAERTLRISSDATLTSRAGHNETEFQNDGPLPPVAEETTEYTLSFSLKNGSNDLTGGEMTATLPQYVEWLDNVSAGDTVTYNPSTRVITWNMGNIDANTTANAAVQVAFTPSVSQIGKIPTLVETQRFRANDRFTSVVIRSEAPALTTAITSDSGRVSSN